MKKLFLLPLLLLLACGDNSQQKATQLYEQADSLFRQNDHYRSLQLLDSLATTYPHQTALQRQGIQLKRHIQLAEYTRNLHYIDSLLPLVEKVRDEHLKTFTLVRDSIYQPIGYYTLPYPTGTHLEATVSPTGELTLTSVYRGAKITHTGIKVTLPNGTYALSPIVPYDGAFNYHIEEGSTTTEKITFKTLLNKSIMDLITSYPDQPITVNLQGGTRQYSYPLTSRNKEQLQAADQLAHLLTQTTELTRNKQVAERGIAVTRERIAQKSTPPNTSPDQ